MIRYLMERIPFMICPRWVFTRVQPIAIAAHLLTNNWTVVAVTHRPTNFGNLTPHVIDADVAVPYKVQLTGTS